MTINLRAQSAYVIYDVMQGRSLREALSQHTIDPKTNSLIHAICYGVCRWFYKLDGIAKRLLTKPLKKKDQDIYALILVGLYQLLDMNINTYAVVDETVEATRDMGKSWAKGLVNAVLRNYLRSKLDFERITPADDDVAFYSHPKWLIEKIKENYPEHWETILNENNQYPPLALRVNTRKTSRDDYLKKLEGLDINASSIAETMSGVSLQEPRDVKTIPGFSEGEVSVQDGAAQLAAPLLLLESGLAVLDACAAPGSKTAHILELQPNSVCVAVDQDGQRLAKIEENLKRLSLVAKCLVADAQNINVWWDGKLFDRILLDVPCSASGVIRRHPDIKLLRRATDLTKLVATQLNLLTSLWSILKPGGILLYSTCSIFPEENELLLEQFLHLKKDAIVDTIDLPFGMPRSIGRQILPGMYGMDGFYYGRFRKQS